MQRLQQHAQRARMKLRGGDGDQQVETPTVECAGRAERAEATSGGGRGVASERMWMRGCSRGARKQSQLTIFCDATGAGSSLYFRALSGGICCDIVVIARWWWTKDPGRDVQAQRRGFAVAPPSQFHAQTDSTSSAEARGEGMGWDGVEDSGCSAPKVETA